MMGDRKYRQRGYQDTGREERESRPKARQENFGPRTPKMPGTHAVSRCGGRGGGFPPRNGTKGKSPRRGFGVYSWKQWAYFFTSARVGFIPPDLVRLPPQNLQ